MTQIWILYLINLLISFLMNSFCQSNEIFIMVLFFSHVLLSLILIMKMEKSFRSILLMAYLFRVITLLFDIYGNNIYSLPNSGSDSEMYYYYGIEIFKNPSLIFSNTRGGLYSKVLGILFIFSGGSRIYAQYLNVLLGLSIIIILQKIMRLNSINLSIQRKMLFIVAIFPNSIIMSSILLREITPTFFLSYSLYQFVLWYYEPKKLYLVNSLIFVGIATMFHSGLIGVAIVYLIVYVLYKPNLKSFKINVNSIITLFLILFIFYAGYKLFGNMILSKFGNIEDIESIYSKANSRLGGSSYLNNLRINNVLQLILYSPVKLLYFFIVPVPFDWRGAIDIFSFLTDSLFYLIVIYKFIGYFIESTKKRSLIICFIALMIIVTGFIFGIGVSNAGTAIRHRQKFTPLFITLLSLLLKYRVDALRLKDDND